MLSTTELDRPTMRPAAATKPYALIVEDEPALVELLRQREKQSDQQESSGKKAKTAS